MNLVPAPYVAEPMQLQLDVEETPDTSSDDSENSSAGITPVGTLDPHDLFSAFLSSNSSFIF